LADFVRDFGNGLVSKSQFAYEAVNSENFREVLNSTDSFTKEQFYSMLRKKKMSDAEYKDYIKDWNLFAKGHEQKYGTKFDRWDYLEHYNKNDVEIMVPPICNLIEKAFKAQDDMLQNFSLASVSIQQRYASLFKNFDVTQEYTLSKSLNKPYYFSLAKCRGICYRYLKQDLAVKKIYRGFGN
jgi:hypothetical protein